MERRSAEPCARGERGGFRPAWTDPRPRGEAMVGVVERYDIPEQHFWLREPWPGRPVAYDAATGTWSVYGYSAAQEILADPARFSSTTMRLGPKGLMPSGEEFSMQGFLTQIDPPEHGKLRKLVSSAFTRRVV